MQEYCSLKNSLDGYFDKPLKKLPAKLKKRIESEFNAPWDLMGETRRISRAEQIDYQQDPAYDADKEYWWELYQLIETKRQELQKWQNTETHLAANISQKESRIEELQAELKLLADLNEEDSVYRYDEYLLPEKAPLTRIKSTAHLRWLRHQDSNFLYTDALKKLKHILQVEPANIPTLIDHYENLFKVKKAVDSEVARVEKNGTTPKEKPRALKLALDDLLDAVDPAEKQTIKSNISHIVDDIFGSLRGDSPTTLQNKGTAPQVEAGGMVPASETDAPVLKRSAVQNEALLKAIVEAGYTATSLPKQQKGRPGAKANIRGRIVVTGQSLFTQDSFDHTWKRLRKSGEIKDS